MTGTTKKESQLESLKAAACETEAKAAAGIVTAYEPAPPHPLLQELDTTKVSEIYRAIADDSFKRVYNE
jgi:hypothetical protein